MNSILLRRPLLYLLDVLELSPAEDLFAKDSDLFLDEVCTWLALQHNITISPSTLSRNLAQAGITRNLLQRLASERDEAYREDFKANLRNNFVGDGSEFVVLDENSKNERTYARHYGRAPNGQRVRLTDVFVQGDRYSPCATMTMSFRIVRCEMYTAIYHE
ncbi:hypothetical protein AZE42_09282 [Rhizopogon vesiculosus]|uniref:Transposase n=1 Tax=Rhizopogon vesiculosus TaxID=180088 RepID=A0A1J8Q022_9AGAM|nr:hypothetical protein AZE42_09282 [Rhizopogon vesiculosus]